MYKNNSDYAVSPKPNRGASKRRARSVEQEGSKGTGWRGTVRLRGGGSW